MLNPLYEQGATARSNVNEKAPTTTMVLRMTSQKLYGLGALLRTRYEQQTLNPLYEQGATARSNISEKAPTTTTTVVIRIGFFSQITICEYSTLDLVCCHVHETTYIGY
jgi:hypothetical protein